MNTNTAIVLNDDRHVRELIECERDPDYIEAERDTDYVDSHEQRVANAVAHIALDCPMTSTGLILADLGRSYRAGYDAALVEVSGMVKL